MNHKGLVRMCANRYRYFLRQRPALSMEDLMQEGYLAVLEAEKTWQPEKGAFSTWAVFYIRKAMRKALELKSVGGKSYFRPAPASLDAPVPESEELSLLDTIADPDAWDGGEMAASADECRVVREAVEQLPADQYEIAMACLIGKQPLAPWARERGLKPQQARDLEYKAIRSLRQLLQPYAAEMALDGETNFYRSKGRIAFNTTRCSAVEDIVFDRERRRKS